MQYSDNVRQFGSSGCFYWGCKGCDLVRFYGISTIVGYLMPNPVFAYMLNTGFINTFCRYIKFNYQTVLFLTIQFNISHYSIEHYLFIWTQSNVSK